MVHLDGYTLGPALGEGEFAVCRIGHKNDRPDVRVAVKTLIRSHRNFDEKALKHEIHIMQKISHPRCVNLLEVREDAAAVHLVEELAAGGELFDRIIARKFLSEKEAGHLIHQVFDGIQYLHTHGIIHRDLKPENLLMVGSEPDTEEYMMLKICDFGLSAQRSEAKTPEQWKRTLQQFCGTQDYLAPEVFMVAAEPKNKHHYTGKVDVWAAGVIYYIMLCGYPPFFPADDQIMNMITQITEGDYEFHSPEWDLISADSKDFISRCLTVEVHERPTAIDMMEHPIFSSDALPTEHLGHIKKLATYKSRFAVHSTIKSIKALARMEVLTNHSMPWHAKADDPQQKEATILFDSIDSLGDCNGTLQLYEIILYMQEHYQHLFLKKDKDIDGQSIMDEDKLSGFAQFLRDALDLDHDGEISREEFVRGFCVWQMHVHKIQNDFCEIEEKKLLASDVY